MKAKLGAVLKGSLVAILAVSLLLVGPTASVGEYDPWVDLTDDGLIDIFDVVQVALSFGAAGNPTKNVSIINWPIVQPEPAWKEIILVEDLNVTWVPQLGAWRWLTPIVIEDFPIGGYSRLMAWIKVTNFTNVGGTGTSPDPYWNSQFNQAGIYCEFWWSWAGMEDWWFTGAEAAWVNGTYYRDEAILGRLKSMQETIGPNVQVRIMGRSYTPEAINLPSSISALVTIGLYLRNE